VFCRFSKQQAAVFLNNFHQLLSQMKKKSLFCATENEAINKTFTVIY
jgi:hypothetical protein